jgi:hypothetical protein
MYKGGTVLEKAKSGAIRTRLGQSGLSRGANPAPARPGEGPIVSEKSNILSTFSVIFSESR